MEKKASLDALFETTPEEMAAWRKQERKNARLLQLTTNMATLRSTYKQKKRAATDASPVTTNSIPAKLRAMSGYMDKATTMKILKIEKTAFYTQVKKGLIPATRWAGSGFRIDPLVLADKLDGVTT